MKKVIWTPTARKSLQQTAEFVTEIWGEQVTEQFLQQLDYRISQIQKNPDLAPTIKNSEFRKLLIRKTSSIFYRNYRKYIKLLLVWDNRQNPVQLLNKLIESNKD